MHLPRLNEWSAKLLILVITTEVFHLEQRTTVLCMLEEDTDNQVQYSRDSRTRTSLDQSLQLWHDHFLGLPLLKSTHSSVSYFQRSALTVFYLTRIYVRLSITDIQDCLGRSGPNEAATTLRRLRIWTEQAPEDAYLVVMDAATCITYIMEDDAESAPYDIITLFLCRLSLWIIANAASNAQKETFATKLRDNPLTSVNVCTFIEAGFAIRNETGHSTTLAKDNLQLILRHAVQVLVQLGTWGASSNLALLLHLHPGMEQRGFG